MEHRSWSDYYENLRNLQAQAEEALRQRDAKAARGLARQLLADNTDLKTWHYGNVVHDGNQILGLVALQIGDIDTARGYLLAAGETPGSPQLGSFGPKMSLAQALLQHGERETVLAYLEKVRAFWVKSNTQAMPVSTPATNRLLQEVSSRHDLPLRHWKSEILAGKIPLLNRIGWTSLDGRTAEEI